ncbi:AAA family ATPase [Oceanospirillum beijerinckii]|uniref:AAA family ATPase n=1 Tax=Oceanospirillum beijerinckii TaxID=64976 RepID=UPI00040BD528|nr:AAA family ATPase [Oceanospirillum beijerinckii]
MELLGVKVSGLFGCFNHTLMLNEANKVTILTGPNGYGKTVLLKILDSVISLQLDFFHKLEFELIEVFFSRHTLRFTKEVPCSPGFQMMLDQQEETRFSYREHFASLLKRRITTDDLELLLPQLERINSLKCYDRSIRDIVDINEVVERYPDVLALSGIETSRFFPDWYIGLVAPINAHFIRDQRLISRDSASDYREGAATPKTLLDTIEQYALDLAQELRRYRQEYAELSQQLDASLPVRLLGSDSQSPAVLYSSDQVREQLGQLLDLQQKLQCHQLLHSHLQLLQTDVEIRDQDRAILTLYIDDTRKKLAVFQPLLAKIETFIDLLNDKGLAFKTAQVDIERGLVFKNHKGQSLSLNQLSSGEQHQIILLFELIFRAGDNDLILIDEPEISLHIAWQKEFLHDLQQIIADRDVKVLIATHSPQIIDSEWDLTVDLEDE